MLKSEEINAIKKKIKDEMNRRCLAGLDQGSSPTDFGSLRSFGSETYDFTQIPAKNGKILREQGEKTINVLYEIKDLENLDYVKKESQIPYDGDFLALNEYLDRLSIESIEGTDTSCRGACSGLCSGSCINGCNGCSGNCNTGCQGCSATCGSGCAFGAKS